MFLDLRLVIYNVDDMQKAKEWYSEVLNAKPAVDQSSQIVFNIGSDRMCLNLVEHPLQRNGLGPVAYWTVSDINAEYSRLIELGALEQGGIREMGEGIRLAVVKDPFGNMIGIGGMSGIPDNKAIENKPSVTALWTTHMRAFSTKEENEEIRGKDNLAEIFLYGDQLDSLRDMENRQRVKEKYFVKGIYEYVMARTSIFDRFFKLALGEDFKQVYF